MDNGHPESPAHDYASDERLVRIVSRAAVSVALVVLIALPLAYLELRVPGPSHHFGICGQDQSDGADSIGDCQSRSVDA